MVRYCYENIREHFLDRSERVLLWGPPCVGKSYLLRALQDSCGGSYVTVDLTIDRDFRSVLSKSLAEGKSLCDCVSEFFGISSETVKHALYVFLDGTEILKDGINGLLASDLPEHMALTTSRIDYFDIFRITKENVLFPINVPVLSFCEFLDAVTEGTEISYTDLIRAHSQNHRPLPGLFDDELRELFHDYLLFGGYPEAVLQYKNSKTDLTDLRRVHGMIFSATIMRYLNDAPADVGTLKIRQLFSYLGEYAEDCRGRFHPGRIRRGAQADEFQTEIKYLTDNGVLIPVCEDGNIYRFEIADCGLLRLNANDYDIFYNTESNETLPEYFYMNYLNGVLSRKGISVSVRKRGRQFFLSDKDGTVIFRHSLREKTLRNQSGEKDFSKKEPFSVYMLTDRKNSGQKSDHNIQYYFLEQTQF